MINKYDVIAIGSGPAVLFGLLELMEKPNLKVLLLEKARRLNDSRNVSNGWFGGSARALVHMFNEPGFGGFIKDQIVFDRFFDKLKSLPHPLDEFKFQRHQLSDKLIGELHKKSIFVDTPNTLVLKEDHMSKLGDFLYKYIKQHVYVVHKTDVTSIVKSFDEFTVSSNNGIFTAPKILMGLGRGGADWLKNITTNFYPEYTESKHKIGVRLEFSASDFKSLFGKSHFFRLRYDDFKTTLPTINGSVETEEIGYVKNANGRKIQANRTPLVNIGIMKTITSTKAHANIYRLVEMANVLNDGQILREPINSYLAGGSILDPIPEFRELRYGVAKFIGLFQGINPRACVYAPEARMNAIQFTMSPEQESTTKGLYMVGDMTGHTSSFVQAACSGMLAAKAIRE